MKDVLVLLPTGDNPPTARLIYGVDVREGLRALGSASVHCVVTSPPYWALRDYGTEPTVWGGGVEGCEHSWEEATTVRKGSTNGRPDLGSTLMSAGGVKTLGPGRDNDHGETSQYRKVQHATCLKCGAWRGQLGQETDSGDFVRHMVDVFREVHRVLRDDGTLWLNLGDSYDEKRLQGIPWRVALALQEDGWWLRNDVIWQKENPLPSPTHDRFSCTYEHIFLLTKSRDYFFDLDAVRVPHTYGDYNTDGSFQPAQQWLSESDERGDRKMDLTEGQLGTNAGPPRRFGRGQYHPGGKNPGDVLRLPTQPFPGMHFAVFPEGLPEMCVRAGTSEHGVCIACSAPWVRSSSRRDKQGNAEPSGGPKAVVSQEKREAGGVGRLDGGRRSAEGSTFHNNPRKRVLPVKTSWGWEPSCSCGVGSTSRAVVLDPFSGSATTGRVSLRLGRDYVGTDLCESYLPMAVARLRDDPPPDAPTPPVEGSILDVFGED